MRQEMRLLHFADLHLGVETYGHLDPQTGLSSRFQDFLACLDQVVDYALNNQVHLVLFCGDAYKSREPSPTQQREFARRLAQLTSAHIPVLLLVGNHDQPQALGKATAVDIFDTLAIRNTIVAHKPGIYRMETAAGPVQIVALPWLKRSAFLAQEGRESASLDELNLQMRQKLTTILEAKLSELDPNVPAVLAAHVWIDMAKPSGSERILVLGGEPQLLLSTLTRPQVSGCPVFSYVALGHIHRHQVLSHRPLVAYCGSLERLDFRDEGEEKGFMVVELRGKEVTSWDFHPVAARRFLTIDIKLGTQDTDPSAMVLQAIAQRREEIRGAIVRVNITLPSEVEGLVREADLRRALEGASYVAAISKEVKRETRLRLGGMAVEKMSPLKALEEYLKQRKVGRESAQVLLEYGQSLLLEGEED